MRLGCFKSSPMQRLCKFGLSSNVDATLMFLDSLWRTTFHLALSTSSTKKTCCTCSRKANKSIEYGICRSNFISVNSYSSCFVVACVSFMLAYIHVQYNTSNSTTHNPPQWSHPPTLYTLDLRSSYYGRCCLYDMLVKRLLQHHYHRCSCQPLPHGFKCDYHMHTLICMTLCHVKVR